MGSLIEKGDIFITLKVIYLSKIEIKHTIFHMDIFNIYFQIKFFSLYVFLLHKAFNHKKLNAIYSLERRKKKYIEMAFGCVRWLCIKNNLKKKGEYRGVYGKYSFRG